MSVSHLQQVLDEQCYRIGELEDDELDHEEDDDDDDHPGDGESPGWEPIRNFTSPESETDQSGETRQSEETDSGQDRVGLKEPDEISSDSMQNPRRSFAPGWSG